jgi:hypothetical protein
VANIVSVQAINFSNTQARRYADARAQSYLRAKAMLTFWNANTVSAVIPNTTDVLIDGAAQDGRQIITGAMVTNIITRCQEEITDFEASVNAKLNTIMALAVNFVPSAIMPGALADLPKDTPPSELWLPAILKHLVQTP